MTTPAEKKAHNRWQISSEDKAFLEQEYERDRFPSPESKKRLSDALGVEPKKIQVWFQNRRQRSEPKVSTGGDDTSRTSDCASSTGSVGRSSSPAVELKLSTLKRKQPEVETITQDDILQLLEFSPNLGRPLEAGEDAASRARVRAMELAFFPASFFDLCKRNEELPFLCKMLPPDRPTPQPSTPSTPAAPMSPDM